MVMMPLIAQHHVNDGTYLMPDSLVCASRRQKLSQEPVGRSPILPVGPARRELQQMAQPGLNPAGELIRWAPKQVGLFASRLTRATPPYIIPRVKYFTDPEGPTLIAGVLAGIMAGGVVYWFVDRHFSSGNFRWAAPALVLAGALVAWLWQRRSRRRL